VIGSVYSHRRALMPDGISGLHIIPVLCGYRPESNAPRAGVQTAEHVNALSNRIPVAARRSMLGVWTIGLP